ncbi:MAG: DUF1572 family protein [Planctomycetota bacterium]
MRNQIEAFAGEFRRYRSLAERSFEPLTAAQWHRRLLPDGNSVATLVQHLGGNLRSRYDDFLYGDGETSWRNRDREFDDLREDPAALRARWDAGWAAVETALAPLKDSDLGRHVCIRQVPLTVAEALARSVAHAAYHTGQIALLCQWLRGAGWQNLSVPRGGSVAYRANPDKEKPPGAARS